MRPIDAATAAVAIVAVAVPAFVVTHPPRIRPRPVAVLPSPRIVPKAELPAVEPMRFVDLSPNEARAYNSDIPFSTGPNPAARPFHFAGAAEDRARAVDCMAAGTLYEAGDDTQGEKAVAQVVLNRLRHPAFPKTVCGVVFEGQERSTGCQFSFSCDGAMQRWHPTDDAWRRAREVATAALSGTVDRPIGYATHYHTDWVVPYWQSSLDKIAAVHTHLFFRWSGWWGTPPAFDRHPDGHEPMIAQLAAISDAHRLGVDAGGDGDAPADPISLVVRGLAPSRSDPDSFLTTLDPTTPASFQALALKACGDRPKCRVMGWTDGEATALSLPLTPEQVAALSFSYMRDRSAGYEKMLWNCIEFPATTPARCMKRQVLRHDMPTAPEPRPTASPTAASDARRRSDNMASPVSPSQTQ
ncbi:cell wall hydrolase [uncultured Sphingomonas sp.]|uniref:cell wall hydrolase n=1 Tax=uncultured Sphingomonas sp. TaxID=158754 RepID=UPI0035CA8650